MRRRLTFLILVAGAALALPSTLAIASRPPTGKESQELQAAAANHDGVSTTYFTLGDVRVSTIGPWASATLNHPYRGVELKAEAVFRERPRGWRLEASGSGGICIGPGLSALGLSHAIGEDLGLPYCSPPHDRSARIFVVPTFGGTKRAVRPHRMDISGDGTFSLYALVWRTWGSSTAVAAGRAYDRGCTPDCAEGQVFRPRVKVRLSDPVRCEGALFYTRLFHRQYGRIPPGSTRRGTFAIRPTWC